MTTTTRFLVLSDTHEGCKTGRPYSQSRSAPKADVLLHCGDLTQCGGLKSFKIAMENIKTTEAELKLIIAGNHDLELDATWGFFFLDEGTHTFTFKNGKIFTVYATPYTPAFKSYAVAHEADQDRFNAGANPMPDNVDIVMPHGPPAFQESTTYTLGANKNGKHCGCSKLAQALKRAQPKLACFGHIHDGRGVMDRNWQTNTIEPYPIDKVDTFDMINIAAQFEGKRC